jgi:hypothetical protein
MVKYAITIMESTARTHFDETKSLYNKTGNARVT